MRSFILSICLVLGLSVAVVHAEKAAPGTPDALIHELYKSGRDVFLPTENKKLASKFLTAELVGLLIEDAKRSQEEPGAIDFDPLTNTQEESDIKEFKTESKVKGDTAIVKASFKNMGDPTVITYECVKEAGQWRIADVRYEGGTSVLKLLKDAQG